MSKEKKQEESKGKVDEKSATQEQEQAVTVPSEFADIVKKIEEMSVLQLSELVKVLEKKFGVSAATPVAVAAVPAVAVQESEKKAEEKSTFDVELTEVGSNKIAVIKAVRAITQLGLKDVSDLVGNLPKVIKEAATKENAAEIKKQLEEAGAKVTLK